MRRILQGFVANQYGGISMYLYRNYLYLDHNNFQYDFLYLGEVPDFAEECSKKGAKFYQICRLRNPVKYAITLWKIIKNNEYDAISLNFSFSNILPVLIARLAGVEKIYLHAHAKDIESNNFIKKILLKIYHNISLRCINIMNIDKYFACSNDAGEFMFGKKVLERHNYYVLNNAIDGNAYKFSPEVRKVLRTSLCIDDDEFVIGHIGRFSHIKNHNFLLDIFIRVLRRHKKSRLMLIGKGELEHQIRNRVRRLKIEDKVMFMGTRNDVELLMQVMDCFVLPSYSEGLGMVGIEAQAAGMQCYVSDNCPVDLKITDLVHYLSLNDTADEWADRICRFRNVERRDMSESIKNAGFDIVTEIKKLENLYKSKVTCDERD